MREESFRFLEGHLAKTLIRVLVVDDHPMIRAGLSATISPEPDMTVVGSASTGREGLEQYRQHRPDVTLMDMKMPDMGGVEAIRTIRAEFPSARIIARSRQARSHIF